MVFAQSKLNCTSVDGNDPVGVNANMYVWAAPAGMVTGVFAVLVTALVLGSVVWYRKVVGTLVIGEIPQPVAAAWLELMMVANAVAGTPTFTERLLGRTAACKAVPEMLMTAKSSPLMLAAPTETLRLDGVKAIVGLAGTTVYALLDRTKKLYWPFASVAILALDAPCSSTGTDDTPAPSAPVTRPESITPTLAVRGTDCHPPLDMNATVPAKLPDADAVKATTVDELAPVPRLKVVPETRLNAKPLPSVADPFN